MGKRSDPLREHLVRALEWEEAHVSFEDAVDAFPARLPGVRADGYPHSAWELLEHIRLAQHDLLEFCRNPNYVAGKWPEDYWPPSSKPPRPESWQGSVNAVSRDRKAFQRFVETVPDLTAAIPNGKNKTYLRSVLLSIDHTSYHVGQLVMVRQLLGAWPR